MKNFVALLIAAASANAYFLVGHSNILVSERVDPIVNPGGVSSHVHTIQGGSGFGPTVSTAQLRASKCTTVPIKEDKSNYWIPMEEWFPFFSDWWHGYVHYLFSDTPGTTTAFPENFRMISGDTTLRTYNASSIPRQAVTFLCLDFNGVSKTYNELPRGVSCPSGIRSQLNFPSCWDGKNVDSPDHKSHVAFLSEGVDKGSCTDPNFPVTLPRIFLEFYWDAQDWEVHRPDALDPQQPFVFSNGDATGNGYHGDYYYGWDQGVLQKVVDGCHCNEFGDPTCCSDAGLFTFNKSPPQCTIEATVDEVVLGTLPKLPGNNPVTGGAVPQPGGASSPASTSVGTKDIPPATTSGAAPASTPSPTSGSSNSGTASNSGTGSSGSSTSNSNSGSNASSSGSSGSSSSSSNTGSTGSTSSPSGSNSGSNASGSSSTPSNSGSNTSGSSSMPSGADSGSSGSSSTPSDSGSSGSSTTASSGSSSAPNSGSDESSVSSSSSSSGYSNSGSNSGSSSSGSSSSGPSNSGSSNSGSSSPPKCKQRKTKRVESLLERELPPNGTQSTKFKAHRSLNRRWNRIGSIH